MGLSTGFVNVGLYF